MQSMRNPREVLNICVENQVTASGLNIPIVAPIKTHSGNNVASRSANFSIAVGSGSAGLPASARQMVDRRRCVDIAMPTLLDTLTF